MAGLLASQAARLPRQSSGQTISEATHAVLKPQCTQQTLRKVSDEAPSAGEWLLSEMALRARKLRSIANLMARDILGSGLNNFLPKHLSTQPQKQLQLRAAQGVQGEGAKGKGRQADEANCCWSWQNSGNAQLGLRLRGFGVTKGFLPCLVLRISTNETDS